MPAEPRPRVRVADVMLHAPKLTPATATVRELRALFADDHVHVALVVDAGSVLVSVVERADLEAQWAPATPAARVGALSGRVAGLDDDAEALLVSLVAAGRRRMAVVDGARRCVGLLCIKRRGTGFCSDDDVAARAEERAARAR